MTENKIVGTVRVLAEENPHFEYTGQGQEFVANCSYAYDSIGSGKGQGCIIGQALVKAGSTTIAELASVESRGSALSATDLADLRPDWFGPLRAIERLWIDWVQEEQDGGKTWQEAVEVADMRRHRWEQEHGASA